MPFRAAVIIVPLTRLKLRVAVAPLVPATCAVNEALVATVGVPLMTPLLPRLKPGGRLISISGPPDPAFADAIHVPWMVKQVMRLLSLGVRGRARRRDVDYAFLFMQADGGQLRQITVLVESGAIRPVLDRVFPFDSTNEALAYVESGRAKGKVVIKLR